MITVLIIAVVFIAAASLLIWGLCRAAADIAPVDEGRAFGGQYGPRDE